MFSYLVGFKFCSPNNVALLLVVLSEWLDRLIAVQEANDSSLLTSSDHCSQLVAKFSLTVHPAVNGDLVKVLRKLQRKVLATLPHSADGSQ